MSNRSLRIVAVGDLSFNGHYHRLLDRYGPEYPLRFVMPAWRDADLRIGNLESPLTAESRVAPSKLTLRATPYAIDALRYGLFDCVSVANNHTMDFGPDGLSETCGRLAAAGIAHVGAGNTEKAACSPAILTRRGSVVGVLAFCDVEQKSPLYAGPNSAGVVAGRLPLCLRQVRAVRPHVDWLIILFHWGTEMAQLPSPQQRDWAHKLVDAGADLLLGHHPGVLQPVELIDGVPVFYSLGIFLFSNMYWRGHDSLGSQFLSKVHLHSSCRKTGWVEIVLRKGMPTEFQFHPAVLTRRLTVVPEDTARRQTEWSNLGRRLETKDYNAEYAAEYRRVQSQANSQQPLARRIELRLFKYGLLPNAVEEA